jgi:predicted ATP-grasp superfamily ATP-dependent carboligase
MIKNFINKILYDFSISLNDFYKHKVLEKKHILYETAEKLNINTEKLKLLEKEKKSLHIAKCNDNKYVLKGARGKIHFRYFTEEEKPLIHIFLTVWNLYIHSLKEYEKFIKEDLPVLEEQIAKEEFYEKAQQKIFSEVA